MARIPTGNFGNVVAEGARKADTSNVWRAAAGVGNAAMNTAQEIVQRRQAEARSKAANEVLDHELRIKTQEQEIGDRLARGEISADDASTAFDKAAAEYKAPKIDYLDPIAAEGLERGRRRTVEASRAGLDRVIGAARRRDGQARFTSALDSIGKLAGLPGADVAAENAKADALLEMAQQAGIPVDQATLVIQNRKDANWFNEAQGRAMAARNDLEGLKALAKDLTAADGFYAGKLDTERRNAVLRSVQSDQDRLLNRAEAHALRQEAKAERALGQIDRQIASGVPATAEMWAEWADVVKGTPQAAEFRERVKAEKQVQEVLRQPIADQVGFVQQQEAQLLQNGGTVQQAANVARLKEAVKRNVTLLQEAPLLFQQNRTGSEVTPIDFTALGSEEGGRAVASQLHDRVLTLDAMRKQYGDQVQMRPLLPQEAQVLGAALDNSTPKQMAEVFGSLREAVGDDAMFLGIMQQIAPDSPVRAVAGSLAAKQRSLTLERNWIADDVVASSRDVASTILAGEQILNRGKAAKAQDGKTDKGLFMPGDAELQQRFANEVGGAFANRPGAADVAFQVVKAYYAGKAAETGRIAANPQDVDGKLVREAVTAALGNVIDYNGKGEVLAPWGMGEEEFDRGVEAALEVAARGSADPAAFRDRAGMLGLSQRSETSYYLRSGRGFVTDAQGKPIVIDVTDPTGAARRGVIAR